VCLSTYLSITHLSIHTSVSICIRLSIYRSVYLSIYLGLYTRVCLSIYRPQSVGCQSKVYLYLSICNSVCLSIYLFINLDATCQECHSMCVTSHRMSIYLFINLSIYQSICNEGSISTPLPPSVERESRVYLYLSIYTRQVCLSAISLYLSPPKCLHLSIHLSIHIKHVYLPPNVECESTSSVSQCV